MEAYSYGLDVLAGQRGHFALRVDPRGRGEIFGAVDARRQVAVSALQSWLGVPYIWGGADPSRGLDCSGAVSAAWRAAGIGDGKRRTADQLYRSTESIAEGDVLPGDLVFYGSPSKVSHVMVAIGDGRVIGSTGGGPSTTSPEIARQQGAGIQIKLAGYRRDVVGFGRAPISGYVAAGWPWYASAAAVAAGLAASFGLSYWITKATLTAPSGLG